MEEELITNFITTNSNNFVDGNLCRSRELWTEIYAKL